MNDRLISDCLDILKQAGAHLEPGLGSTDLTDIESEFAFRFSRDHRDLLSAALPIGEPAWVDWRQSDRDELRERVDGAGQDILEEVADGTFWPVAWGKRPQGKRAVEVASEQMAVIPKMIPIYLTRCVAARPSQVKSPVFSIYGSDVVLYGRDLLDYFRREFTETLDFVNPVRISADQRVPFWSDLADGVGDYLSTS